MRRLPLIVLALLVYRPLAAWAQTPPAPPPQPADGQPPEGPPPAGIGTPQPATASPEPPPPPAPPPPGGTTVTPPAPTGSDFMDTRLVFVCTDEDLLRDPTVLPPAPGFHCGRPNSLGILFFDNYDTRFSGFETLSHLALYKHWAQGHWDIEGGFIIRMNEFAEDNIRLSDGGSYIRTAYWFDPTHADQSRVALVAFPVSADRMRLGYSYRISWGGSPEFFKANPDQPTSTGKNANAVPGAKLQWENGHAYAYVGMKSSLLLDPVINEQRAVLAFLAGLGVDIGMVHIDANGGYFDRGKNEAEDVLGEPVVLYGASAQIALHQGMAVGSSIDYALYRNEPAAIGRLFAPEAYPGGLSWLVSAEGTTIFQTLKDPSAAGSTRTQQGMAGDVNVRVKYDTWRFRLDLEMQDLAYILHTIPSLPTYWDFPDTYQTTPELFAAAGVDRYFPAVGVLVGVTGGIEQPATLTTPTAAGIPGNLTNSTTLVIRNATDRSVLPAGEAVAPLLALKGTIRKELGPNFAGAVDVYYQYDPNTVRYDRSSNTGSFNVAQFANFNQLGFNVSMQARF